MIQVRSINHIVSDRGYRSDFAVRDNELFYVYNPTHTSWVTDSNRIQIGGSSVKKSTIIVESRVKKNTVLVGSRKKKHFSSHFHR